MNLGANPSEPVGVVRRVAIVLLLVCAIVLTGLGYPTGPQAQAGYDIFLSSSPDRSGAVLLDGETVNGDIYVFTSPDTNVSKVRFLVDGSFVKEEKHAPYDLAGTAGDGSALPLDTTPLAEGLHNLVAEVFPESGSVQVISANFTVGNSGPALLFNPLQVWFATETGTNPSDLTVYLAASDGAAVGYTVSDDAGWLTTSPITGTTPETLTLSVDVTGLAQGTYNATATATDTGYTPASLTVSLNVVDSQTPDQVHLAWVADPATTLEVVWRTFDISTPSTVEYREASAVTWQTANGSLRPSGTAGTLHQAQLGGLTPSTGYEYRVQGDNGTWSDIFTTRTAPPKGSAGFDAVFVADTGIIGRTDGLATGT